ncbi:MAG: TlpA disulfide reductase family protein [Pseudomonadota bacterium]
MGRLSSVSASSVTLVGAFAVLALAACDTVSEKDAPMATNERSQAITQKGPLPVSSPAPVTIPVATTQASAAKKPRTLCGGKQDESHYFPKKKLSRAAGKTAPPLPESPLVGSGKWTWVNFWAAWCAPCKEEIPRLLGFEKKLGAGGAAFRLSFVSLDDDERQLNDFLDTQPAAGLHASYWLKEGNEREDWLKAAGLSPDSPLPFHILVDPKGKIRCAIQGAVEDGDFTEISSLVAAR